MARGLEEGAHFGRKKKDSQDTGYARIASMRFCGMSPIDGVAPCGHPSLKTHVKMADELVKMIRSLE